MSERRWFKMYPGDRRNQRLALLNDAQHRVWFNLMCLACERADDGVIEGVAWQWLADEVASGNIRLLDSTIDLLARMRMLRYTNVGIAFEQWDRRRGVDRVSGAQWEALRQAVFERDDFTCQYCGARHLPLECDHILPVSRGGLNEIENLTTACRPCNQSKHDMTPDEWIERKNSITHFK